MTPLLVAHVSDTHICVRHKRWTTLRASLTEMVRQIADAGVDLIVHAGDLGEPHPTGEDLQEQARFLRQLGSIAPVIVVAGNHDSIPHLHVLAQVATVHPLRIVTVPTSLVMLGLEDEPDLVDLSTATTKELPRAVIHCLPWPRKGHLLSLLRELPPPETSDQVALECLRSILSGWRTEREQAGMDDTPCIVAAHLDVSGARGDQGQPLCTPDVSVSVHDLELAGTDAVCLGHIHARQELGDVDGTRIVYAGSPCRLSWGEAGAESKGWGLITWDPAKAHQDIVLSYECVDVASPRLWTVEATYGHRDGVTGQHFYTDPDDSWADLLQRRELGMVGEQDELRFRYHVAEDMREIAKANLHEVMDVAEDCGIARERVTVEAVTVPAMNARAPEIATEQDLVARFDRWIATEGMTIPEDRLTGLHASIRELEQEVTP